MRDWTEEDLRIAESVVRTQMREKPIAEVRSALKRLMNPGLVDEVVVRLQQAADEIRVLRDPPAIEDSGRASWYPGPGKDDRFWPALRTYLASRWRNDVA